MKYVIIASGYQLKNIASVPASFEYNSERYSTSYGIKAGDVVVVNLSARAKIIVGFLWKVGSITSSTGTMRLAKVFLKQAETFLST
ncbi:MAG TPA: hypothetical protein VK625_08900 [Flavitalea sp.]|nr:hypothetical protein [Flavitalea sp.]